MLDLMGGFYSKLSILLMTNSWIMAKAEALYDFWIEFVVCFYIRNPCPLPYVCLCLCLGKKKCCVCPDLWRGWRRHVTLMTRGRHYFEHAIIYKQIFKVGKQVTAPILFWLSIFWVGAPVRCALFFFFLFFIQYDYIFLKGKLLLYYLLLSQFSS